MGFFFASFWHEDEKSFFEFFSSKSFFCKMFYGLEWKGAMRMEETKKNFPKNFYWTQRPRYSK